jgi:hypothetical protein
MRFTFVDLSNSVLVKYSCPLTIKCVFRKAILYTVKKSWYQQLARNRLI